MDYQVCSSFSEMGKGFHIDSSTAPFYNDLFVSVIETFWIVGGFGPNELILISL